MSIDSKSPATIGAGHGYGGMLLQVEEVYNDVKDRFGPTKFMGGYNNRNVRGGNTKSMHAYGRAFDIGGSPEVMSKIAEYLKNNIKGVQYVIYNRRISYKNGAWTKYNGVNPHTDHVHADFLADFKGLSGGGSLPVLKQGSTGNFVKSVQDFLGTFIDGIFGPKTESAVKDFQGHNGLRKDGIVGSETWKKLTSKEGFFLYR